MTMPKRPVIPFKGANKGAEKAATRRPAAKIFSFVAASVALNSFAQIFFKFAAEDSARPGGIFNLWLLGGLSIMGASFFLWRAALRLAPLSFLHPFLATGFLTVPLLSALIFGEKLSMTYFAGIALILAGILITTRNAAAQG